MFQINISEDETNTNGIFFYNRSDYKEILHKLSPFRSSNVNVIMFFHYFGLITNALCIIVLSNKRMIERKSIFYLIMLAISDFMYNFLSELPNLLIKLKLTDHDIFKQSG
jgi:hypothetical protein